MENYVTINQASVFEGVEYHTLYRKVKRNPEDFITKTEATDNGGKNRLLINVKCLSKKAKKAFKEKQNIEGDIKEMVINNNLQDKMPWYVDVDCNWYIENNKNKYYKAIELVKHIEEFLNYKGNNKTEFANEFAKNLGMSSRTLFRKTKKYLEGTAWAMKMSEEDGKNYDYYKVLSLCTKPREKGLYPSIEDEVKVYMENVWFDKTFAQNHGTIAMLYYALENKCKEKSWKIPSYPTVARYINTLMETKENAHYLLEQGTREWRRTKMFKARRNTGALKVMEFVQGDSHTFDCWVSIKEENGKVTAIRPILTAFIDTKSRCLVYWGISKNPNSQIMKKILINGIYKKADPEIPFEGVPKILSIDNGKDFTAETLTGRPRKIRTDFDMETKGFYRSIGIQDDVRSLPYQGWGKAQVERMFGTVCNQFTKWVTTYVGTLTGSRTIGKVKKDIKGMLEHGELMTIEEFTEQFGKWLKEVYHVKKHKGLKEQGEPNPVPILVYKNAERYYKAAPPFEYAEMLLMKSDGARVYATGINKFGYNYLADELSAFIDKKVTIRWNPDDITKIYVYNDEGKKICEAVSQELLAIAPKVAQENLEKHMRRQKRQYKEAKKVIQEMQMPFEERISKEEVGASRKLILPEIKGKTSKIVSLPNDKQFKEEYKETKRKKKDVKSDYFEKQAEDVLELLKSM